MTYQFRPGRLTYREPDTRTYADGRDAAKADSAFLLRIGAAALRDRLDPRTSTASRTDEEAAR